MTNRVVKPTPQRVLRIVGKFQRVPVCKLTTESLLGPLVEFIEKECENRFGQKIHWLQPAGKRVMDLYAALGVQKKE